MLACRCLVTALIEQQDGGRDHKPSIRKDTKSADRESAAVGKHSGRGPTCRR
jgi:hypothetical protein